MTTQIYNTYYDMCQQKLPDWMHIVITNDNDSKYLTVHSRIHMNKEVRVGPEYSSSFSDMDIIKELSDEIAYRFMQVPDR